MLLLFASPASTPAAFAVGDVRVTRFPTSPAVIGDGLRLTATFTTLAGVAADPTTVTLTVKAPDGTTSSIDLTQSATGVYYGDILLNQAGAWYYRFAGSGAVTAVAENAMGVAASKVA